MKVVDYAFEFIGLGLAFWIVAPQLQGKASAVGHHVRPSRIKAKRTSLLPKSVAAMSPKNLKHVLTDAYAEAARRSGAAGIEAASILRTMLGTQLIILAAHDKIFEPGVTLAFVEKYSFVNFPALLGLDVFTNLHFVFGAAWRKSSSVFFLSPTQPLALSPACSRASSR